MPDYYSEKLAANRLKRVYEIATPRIRQYLAAEIDYVTKRIRSCHWVLDLGCGYGRVLNDLAKCCDCVVGIDTSIASLQEARDLTTATSIRLAQMDATALGFQDRAFDAVICIQNGISAFNIDPRQLARECIRVTAIGGIILLSSYSDKIWEARLEWFRLQANAGLLGDVDERATGDGVIVCKDGFRASTFGRTAFESLVREIGVECRIVEIDQSSIFCEIEVS